MLLRQTKLRAVQMACKDWWRIRRMEATRIDAAPDTGKQYRLRRANGVPGAGKACGYQDGKVVFDSSGNRL